jgi:hypothetical protein
MQGVLCGHDRLEVFLKLPGRCLVLGVQRVLECLSRRLDRGDCMPECWQFLPEWHADTFYTGYYCPTPARVKLAANMSG